MNSKIKNIVIGVLVLAVLGGVYAVLKATGGKQGKNSSGSSLSESETAVGETLLSKWQLKREASDPNTKTYSAEDIVSIDIKNASAEYTLITGSDLGSETSGGVGTGTSDGGDNDAVNSKVVIKGYEKLSYAAPIVDTLFSNALAPRIIDNVNGAEASVYGLEAPLAVYVINFSDGEKMTVRLGDTAPANSARYVKIDGVDGFFTISDYIARPFFADEFYYFSTTLCPPDADAAKQAISFDVYKGRISEATEFGESFLSVAEFDGAYKDKMTYPPSHVMKRPVEFFLNVDAAVPLLKRIYGLEASAVTGFRDDLDYSKLTDDIYFVTIQAYEGADGYHTLKIYTNADKETVGRYPYYVVYDDGVLAYGFEETAVDNVSGKTIDSLPWIQKTPEQLTALYTINAQYVYDYRTLDVESEEKKLRFECNGSGERTTFKVKCNGKDLGTDIFQEFNKFLLSAYITGSDVNGSLEIGELTASVTITESYGDIYTVNYYKDKANALNLIAEVNGTTIGTVRAAYLNVLLNNMTAVESGGKIEGIY